MFLCDNLTHTIVMQNLTQAVTAKDCINDLLSQGNKDELVKLARMIGSVVAKMHKSGLIHGDITTSNILVENSDSGYSLVMIDFGLSSLVSRIGEERFQRRLFYFQEGTAEDKGVDLYVLERALLSTHPNTEWLFQEMIDTYRGQYGKHVGEIVKKFEDIRLRGRKRTMLG